ncbi:hypothetical protein N9R25_03390 [Gammaproteobacteria bacterium]|nr:hypothetical protein [Gammaproteobacteria bacterium]
MKKLLLLITSVVFITSCGGGGGGGSSPAAAPTPSGGSSGGVSGTAFDMAYFLGGQDSIEIELFLFKLRGSFPIEPFIGNIPAPIPISCDELTQNPSSYPNHECFTYPDGSVGVVGKRPDENKFICTNIIKGKIIKYDDRNAYFEIEESGLTSEYFWSRPSSQQYSFERYINSNSNLKLKSNTYTSENAISLNTSSLTVEEMGQDIEKFSGTMNLKFTEDSIGCLETIDLNILTVNDGYIIGFGEEGYGLLGYPKDHSVKFEHKDLWGEYDVVVSEMNSSSQPSRVGSLKFKFEDDPVNPLIFNKMEVSSDLGGFSGFTTQLTKDSSEPFSPIFIGLIGNSGCPDFSASFYVVGSSCKFIPKNINVITSFKDEIISFDLEENYLITGVKTLYVQ